MKTSDTPLVTRRRLLTAGAVIPITAISATGVLERETPWREGAADVPPPLLKEAPAGYAFFTPPEAAFIEAAIARLIPADELGPGALEAGVATFIDRQMAGEYGQGARWYMQGPWEKGEKTQGWQSRMSPAQLYRAAIQEVDAAVSKEGKAAAFAKLPVQEQDRWLHQLEDGKVDLPTADAKNFFKLLQQNTIEGFFSDPIYGGNKDMAGWKLIGFPGARYDYTPYVKKHGEKFPLPPVAILGRPEWGGHHG
jgi:gluconate 2-dehydrogenase gamma chain